ncbi:MAG: helix-turn-helix transcriptional regulator [Bdellovibrionales bacterium]|nr:helix-turn-helix transcriptional regulator [Bdellovibrionales bacterium]
MERDEDKFSAVLKDYVMERRKINPRLSESQIAHNLGISNATFHRIMNGRTYPNVKTLITLCRSIPKMKTVVAEEMLEVTRESKTGQYMGEELEQVLSDKDCFITYALALSDNGVTEKEILYCRGYQGQKALKTLTEKGFVKKDQNNIYRATARKGIVLSFEVLKKHLKILAENYKPDNMANNYIYYKMESLNKTGMKELYEVHKEAHRKVQKIMETAEYKGNIPLFSAGFFDMFILKEPKERG